MIASLGSIVMPLFIHLLVSQLTALLLGTVLDAAMCTTLVALIVLPLFIWWYKKDQKPREKERRAWWSYLLLIPLAVGANLLLTFFLSWFSVTEHYSNAAQEGLLSSGFWIQLAGLGVLVPIMEEYLFRGLVYGRLKSSVSGGVAAFLGAAIFALYHGNIPQMLFAFPMALLLIWSLEYWKTLKAPIIFHIAVNISTIILNQIL